MRPPCASTSPRAIASPRPAPRDVRDAIAAPEALEHPLPCLCVEAFARVLDGDVHLVAPGSTRTATAPSVGVCRSAFVRRFMSTRSTLSGAKRARDVVLDIRRERHAGAARFCLDAARGCSRRPERPEVGATRGSARRRRCARARRGRRRASRARGPARAARARTPRARRDRPRAPRASLACSRAESAGRGSPRRRARGVCRRGGRGCSPISLKDAASSATSAGPPPVRAAPRFPRASSTDASRTRSIESAIERASEERRDECGQRRRRGNREDLHVVAHVEHHPSGREHGPEREQHGEHRQARELKAHRREVRRSAREASPTARVARSDDESVAITRRACSRRPRPSQVLGWEGSSSIFSRRRRTCTVTVPCRTRRRSPRRSP